MPKDINVKLSDENTENLADKIKLLFKDTTEKAITQILDLVTDNYEVELRLSPDFTQMVVSIAFVIEGQQVADDNFVLDLHIYDLINFEELVKNSVTAVVCRNTCSKDKTDLKAVQGKLRIMADELEKQAKYLKDISTIENLKLLTD